MTRLAIFGMPPTMPLPPDDMNDSETPQFHDSDFNLVGVIDVGGFAFDAVDFQKYIVCHVRPLVLAVA